MVTMDFKAKGDGEGIKNLLGVDGISVTGSGDARTISGRSLDNRVTGHGRDIAVNRGLANANTLRLLKTNPNNERVTEVKAGTNISFNYTANKTDPTKGVLTLNASGGASIPDTRLWAANSGTNDRLVSNNVHACEFYLGSSSHHDKGVIMWEGNAVDVPNRATKEMARFTHNDSTGECWLRMGLPGKFNFKYHQPDWNSDGTLTLGYGGKAGSITSSQLKALVKLKPLEMGSSQLPVTTIDAGDGITFGYSNGDLTVNAVELELEDGTSVKKVIKKIKAGTNVTFAFANDVLTVNATGGGSGTDADWLDKFDRLVVSGNTALCDFRVDQRTKTAILVPKFTVHQLFSSRSTSSKVVFPDVTEIEISTAGRTDKAQYFNFKRKYDNQFLKLGFFAYGRGWKVGLDASHGEDVFPGKGHALGTIKALITDDHNTGFHTTAVTVLQRKIRAGSTAQKSLTPEGIKSTLGEDRLIMLERKIAKLEKLLKITL